MKISKLGTDKDKDSESGQKKSQTMEVSHIETIIISIRYLSLRLLVKLTRRWDLEQPRRKVRDLLLANDRCDCFIPTDNGNEGPHTPNGKMHAVCESIITIDEVEPEQVPKEEVKAAFTK